MLALQHGHYRPDMVTRTSVVEPYDVQRYSPVEVARHTIDPFIYGVREQGPAVAPAPTAEAVANAAAAVAEAWAANKPASIHIGAFHMSVSPNTPPQGGLVGQIMAAAHGLRTGKPVLVRSSGTKSVIAQARPGSQVIATAKGVAVKASPGPSASIRPTGQVTSRRRIRAQEAYPDTLQTLTTMAAMGPTGQVGPVTPGYMPPLLDRRSVANWYAAGRTSFQAGATSHGAQNGVPGVVSNAQSQVAALRKVGI